MAQSAFDATIMGGPPYFDDFNEAKRFLKVLFRPGRPLQSRELSQVQSILQNQIERFGRHVFQEGSVATGGSVTDCASKFVRITEDLTAAQKTALVGKKLKNSSNVNAVVIGVEDRGDSTTESNDQFVVLCIEYITAGTFAADETLSTYGVDDPEITMTVKAASTGATDPEPTGIISNYVCMDESIFFSNGFFVLSEKVRIAAHTTDTTNKIRDFSNTTCSIGFDVIKSTVDADDDSTLNDPAFGFYNYNSPGADRFKIIFTPIVRALTGSGDEFGRTVETGTDYIEIVRIVNGRVTKKVKYPQYANLESTLARRTHDESGHYTVTPFNISYFKPSEIFPNTYVTDSAEDEAKVALSVSAGKAYLNGYEYEGSGDNVFILDKPRVAVGESTTKQNMIDFYDQNIKTPTVGEIDVSGEAGFLNRRRTNLKGLENIIGGQKRIYMLDTNGKAVGTCYIQQVLSRLGSINQGLTSNDSFVFQLFNVESLGDGQVANAKYLSEKYVSLPSGAGSVPSETISGWTSGSGDLPFDTAAFDFFIWNLHQVSDRTSFRKGSGRYYYPIRTSQKNHSHRVKYIKNLKMTAIKSFTAEALNGEVTITTGGQGLQFASDNTLKASSWSTTHGSVYNFDYEFTIMLTDVISGGLPNNPFALAVPAINRNNFNFNQTRTSLTITGLEAFDGSAYEGTVVVSAPVILDYGINTHGEQKVVRKAMNFNVNTAPVTITETISQNALNFCDSDGDGFLDGSDFIRLSKQFIRQITSVKMGGTQIVSRFKQRQSVEQGTEYFRGSESNKDNRLERGFIQLEPNEKLQITGDLEITYRYYPTSTYGDGSANDGEIIIANSYAKDAGADSAQNPRPDDIKRTPHLQAQSINYANRSAFNVDFRGYEYVVSSLRGTNDSAVAPQSQFNRAFTFGKDKDGGFLPVGLDGSDDLTYTGEFYQHIPSTIYLDEDRKLRLASGPAGFFIDDKFPELKGTQMRIADIKQYGFGMGNYDIGLIYYDNQRTTMAEINEIEKELMENEQYDRLDSLETKAYVQAKSAFPQFTPVDHGTFVDTFEDWSSAYTVNNPGFNSAIDPINESLRPNFTNFFTSSVNLGVTGSNEYRLTDDNIFLPAGSTVDFIRTDTANANEEPVSRVVNPNGIIDFHGHASASPFTQTYWNTLYNPRITPVNNKLWYDAAADRSNFVHPTFGDVFKKNGNGVNYRDHELHWYGMVENVRDPNDVTLDASESIYTRRRKPKSVRRFLKSRPTRKANVADSLSDRVVDTGLQFRGRNYTVTVKVHGLKPNTLHRVFQTDDTGSRNIPLGRGNIAFFTSDSDGSKTFTFEHPEVVEGIEYYLITDAFDSTTNRFNGIENSTSSADFFIYNTGLYPTEEYGIKGIRPLTPRRDASNLGTYENRYYENIPITSTISYNSFTPLTQTFTIDDVGNPMGIFLDSLDIYFKQTPEDDSASLPVTIRIHPVIDGVPNYNVVLPFAERTAKAVTSRETFLQNSNFSRFNFTTPLYLQPGKYAFTIETNDPEYVVHTATTSQAVLKPDNVGELYVPSNNGQSEEINNEFIRFRMNRVEFAQGNQERTRSEFNATFTFADYAGGTASGGGSQWQSAANLNAASYFIANAPRLFTTDSDGDQMEYFLIGNGNEEAVLSPGALGGQLGGDPTAGVYRHNPFNHTLDATDGPLIGALTNDNSQTPVRIYLGVSTDKKVANVIDKDRLGIVAQRFNLNDDDGSGMFNFDSEDPQSNGTEVRPTDALGKIISRYYSKEVVLEPGENANDLVVNMNGVFPQGSRPIVLAKVGKTSAELFGSPYYVCTYLGNNPENGDYVNGDGFPTSTDDGSGDVGQTIDGARDYVFRITPGKNSEGNVVTPLPEKFTRYRLKILMLGGPELSGENEDYIITSGGFEIKSLSAVAGYTNVENREDRNLPESKPGDIGYLYRVGQEDLSGVSIPVTEFNSANLVGEHINKLFPSVDFVERKLGENGSENKSACKVINKTNQPVTYMVNFVTTFANELNTDDGHVVITQSEVFDDEASEITPGDKNDSSFTDWTTYYNDFGGAGTNPQGLTNGTTGTMQHQKLITLQPNQRILFRYKMASGFDDGDPSLQTEMSFVCGGFQVTRIT